MIIKLGMRELRGMSVKALQELLGDKTGVITCDGVMMFKIKNYDAPVDNQSNSLKGVNATEIPPIYNPAIHKPGERVRIMKSKKWQEVIVPEIDGDGHAIPELR